MLLHRLGCLFVFFVLPLFAQSNNAAQSQDPSSAPPKPATETQVAVAGTTGSAKLEIVKRQTPDYPAAAKKARIQGQAIIQVLISETGEVEKAEIVSGEPTLAKSALDAAKKWKFKPYMKNGKPVKVSTKLPFNFAFEQNIMKDGVSKSGAVQSSPEQNGGKRAELPQGVTEGMLVHQVAPVYPPVARTARIQGTVLMDAVIGKDGRIRSLEVISGPEMLRAAAIGAIQQWRYRPYTVEGEPVEVKTQIQVNFTLR